MPLKAVAKEEMRGTGQLAGPASAHGKDDLPRCTGGVVRREVDRQSVLTGPLGGCTELESVTVNRE